MTRPHIDEVKKALSEAIGETCSSMNAFIDRIFVVRDDKKQGGNAMTRHTSWTVVDKGAVKVSQVGAEFSKDFPSLAKQTVEDMLFEDDCDAGGLMVVNPDGSVTLTFTKSAPRK